MDVEIEVPSHFLCPISMQLMRDPVTISTGITYDRVSIERWLFTCRSRICPVTNQPLYDAVLTPNHTLRRLIQSWCTINSHHGFDPIPSPKKPVDKSEILKLIQDAKRHPEKQIKCLRRMRSIAQWSDGNRSCMEECSSDAVEFLTTVVLNENNADSVSEACDEALIVLHHLSLTDLQMRKLVNDGESGFIDALLRVMRSGTIRSRSHTMVLLRSLLEVADPAQLAAIKPDVFQETARILKHGLSFPPHTIKASLELVVETVRWGRNRIKAAESGMVSVLVELLIDTRERRLCELVLVALEQISRCAEGRAELVEHAAGLAAVSKKILRVSHVASDRAVRIVCLVCRFCGSFRVLQEMVEVGVVSKLCLMIQVDCNERTKERVKHVLGLHSRVWRDASCIPAHLLSSYPSLENVN
ncbi:hypothetical protein OSB04_029417 [Centaurea solstitialis]|uniref:U-box domain-containing protein n=1 Tax=Centaurea solstitialis TaxID=347529 RepID=A0AA38SVY3_9ASTR|nr:hypothetical protein OSB04_029417 [Centaurea solstitialis]